MHFLCLAGPVATFAGSVATLAGTGEPFAGSVTTFAGPGEPSAGDLTWQKKDSALLAGHSAGMQASGARSAAFSG